MECAICRETIDVSETLKCNHTFHKKCVEEWIIYCLNKDNDPTCPMCRQEIVIRLKMQGCVCTLVRIFKSIEKDNELSTAILFRFGKKECWNPNIYWVGCLEIHYYTPINVLLSFRDIYESFNIKSSLSDKAYNMCLIAEFSHFIERGLNLTSLLNVQPRLFYPIPLPMRGRVPITAIIFITNYIVRNITDEELLEKVFYNLPDELFPSNCLEME